MITQSFLFISISLDYRRVHEAEILKNDFYRQNKYNNDYVLANFLKGEI